MKVYELIQELAKYDADTEVEFYLQRYDYCLTVEVEEDVRDGEETEVTVDFCDTFGIEEVGECNHKIRLYAE